MRLNPRQSRFVEEYLIDLNATQAAIRAGYSEKSAKQQGSRLLTSVKVQAAIAEAQAARAERTQISQDEVLRELARIGFADMGDYVRINDETGNVHLDFSALPDGATKIIQEIVQEEYVEGRGEDAERVKKTKFKLYNKLDALEKLGRHLSLFNETMKHQHEHSMDTTVHDVVREVEEWFEDESARLPADPTRTKH